MVVAPCPKNGADMSEPVRGIIHVHSDFSRDGLCSISDLGDFGREAGFQFIGLTDHAEDLSISDMESLRRECEKHSDESFAMIPGLEFQCTEDIHILGLGAAENIASTDPVTVAKKIHNLGGLAILAHPGRNGHQCSQELCRVLHGIEIWNAADDGRVVPPPANLHLLQKARGSNLAISALGGVDLHWLDGLPGITIELRLKSHLPVRPEIVLNSLRSANFVVRGRYVAFDAHPAPSTLGRMSLAVFRRLYDVSVAVRDIALGNI